jgi:hypothetical protein
MFTFSLINVRNCCGDEDFSVCHSNVIMSYFCKIKMSGFLIVGVRFSLAKENLHGKGHFKDESERS